jgi:hypothetical protein
MKKHVITILFFLGFAIGVNSQPSQFADYFPLNVGNVYVYKYRVTSPCMPPSVSYFKMRIVKDTIAFGKKYFLLNSVRYNGWYRFDSTNGNLLKFYPGNGCSQYLNDRIYDSLASKFGDYYQGCVIGPTLFRQCIDTSNITFLGITRKSKKFLRMGAFTERPRYMKGIGMVTQESGEPDICNYDTLLGCFVNGVLFGDTLLTSIMPLNSEIPDKYSLSQNYPNPFNPVTKILFEIPSAEGYGFSRGVGLTTLRIYDIAGREVETLVNQAMQPGVYEVTFDARGLSSGIYFYRLEAGNYTETKRMVLLK